MIVAPSYSEQIEIVTGNFTNNKGITIIKVTNDEFEKIEKRVSVLDCSSYQSLPPNEWRTNINPKQKDDDKFILSPGIAVIFQYSSKIQAVIKFA